MYAVIESGNKQYKVAKGDQIQVDRLNVEAGQEIALERVLMVGGDEVKVGAPLLEGAKVTAKVVSHDKADKVLIYKYRPRQRTRRKVGFRASLTTLEIINIEA